MSPAISYRGYQGSDRSFVFSSFLKSQRSQQPLCWLPDDLYYSKQEAPLERYVRDCKITMAVDSEDPDNLIGYSISEGQTVHYLYVKYIFRRLGVGMSILLAAGVDLSRPVLCTCWTANIQLIANRHPNFTYIGKEIEQ